MLAPVGELTFGEPELLELTLVAAELYPEFVAELEAATGRRDRLRAAAARCTSRSTATRRRSCAASTTCSASSGLEAEWLPPRACRELEPGLTPVAARRRARAGRGARSTRGP